MYPTSLFYTDRLTSTETTSIALNAAWDWSYHTTLRFDYQHLQDKRESTSSEYRIGVGGATEVRPVADRDGEELRALTDRFGFQPSLSLSAAKDNRKTTTDIFTFRGNTVAGQLTFDYTAGYTKGEFEQLNSPRIRFTSSASAFDWDDDLFIAAPVDPVEGIILAAFAPASPEDESIPIPLFTPAGFAAVNDPASFTRFTGNQTERFGSNDRYVGEISGRYDFVQNPVQYVQFGVDYEQSDFQSFRFGGGSIQTGSEYANLGSLDIPFDAPFLGGLGQDIGIRTWSLDAVETLFDSLDNFAANDLLIINQPQAVDLGFNVRAKETEIAPYVQMRMDIGDFEIIGGLRYSIIEVEADDLDVPRLITEIGLDQEFADANAVFRTESATQKAILPRFTMNYRPNDNFVIRGGYSKAIARPQLSQLSDRRVFTFDVRPLLRGTGPARLLISEGNEDLKAAETDSFDLAFEYYRNDASAYKLSLFRKEIANLIEQNAISDISFLDGVDLTPYETSTDFQAAFPDGFDIIAEADRRAAAYQPSWRLVGSWLLCELYVYRKPKRSAAVHFSGRRH